VNNGLIDEVAAIGHVELLDPEVCSGAPLVSNGGIKMFLRAISPPF
jgi:hypothetical protein